jgi:hypothetical protein
MTTHADRLAHFQRVLWPDAELIAVSVDYDAVTIEVRESTGLRRLLTCRGHVGYECRGFWDEVIIERAELLATDDFLTDCLKRLRADPLDSGSPARNARSFGVLRIVLLDGCAVTVASTELEVSTPQGDDARAS